MSGSDNTRDELGEGGASALPHNEESRRASALERIMEPARTTEREQDDFGSEGLGLAHEDEPLGHSFAVTALWGVVGVVAIASMTLWLAPKIAPHVPAPVGRVLAPVPDLFEDEISALRSRIEIRERETAAMLEAFDARIAALAGRGADAATVEEIRRLEGELAGLRSALEGTDARVQSADRRAGDVELQIEAARSAMKEALARAVAAERSASAAVGKAGTETEKASRLADAAHLRSTEAAAGLDALDRRLSGVDDRLASLSGEMRAVSTSLAEASEDPADQPVSRELGAALSALQAKVEALKDAADAAPDYLTRAEAEALASAQALEAARVESAARIKAIAEELDAAERRLEYEIAALRKGVQGDIAALDKRLEERIDTLSASVEGARSVAARTKAEALDEAEAALRNAAFRGAADALRTRFDAGDPYASVLAEVELLTEQTAPVVLVSHSATGVPSVTALTARLPMEARMALEARARSATATDSPSARIANWIGTQVVSRPIRETEGTDLAARLSRIEARMRDGALQAARAEAEALPETARASMAGWTEGLVARIEGAAALEAFLAPGFATE